MSVELTNLNTEFLVDKSASPTRETANHQKALAWALPDGALVAAPWMLGQVMSGDTFCVNGGAGSTVIAFAGAYDADAPDMHINVPEGVTIIPLRIEVVFEALGTEATVECIALASNQGDTSVTGTAKTPQNMKINGRNSACVATAAVDAAGCTDPNTAGGKFFEFWHFQKPLADTVATGENDRAPLVFCWNAFQDGPPPIIKGVGAAGSCLAVYAASQAGTGFITVQWVEVESSTIP
jgi:hypothetical protein